MKKLFLIGVFCLFSIPATSFACSCATGPPEFEFNRARMVFIGRMLGGTEKILRKDNDGKSFTIESGKVRFSVEEIFKGSGGEEVTVQIESMDGTSCGPYGLRRRQRYIVYAYIGTNGQNTLYTGVCTRTAEISSDYAKDDLKFLRNLPPPGVGGNLRGSIWADLKGGGANPLPDVVVKISSEDGQVITAITDKKGEFIVKQLKPGKYKVEPYFPANYTSEHKFADVNVDDRGTASVGFEAYIDGRVLGRVVDTEGNRFNNIFLQMEAEGKSVYGHSVSDDGEFEVKGAPPGEYVLYFEMEGKDYSQRKPYYYPGTFEREKATVIRVGLGEKVEGLEFRLPPGALVRTVEGEVVWKDGTPAANVQVMLLCPQSSATDGYRIEFSPTTTTTNEQGRFRLEGFTNQTYWIEARAEREAGTFKVEMHSPSRKLSVQDSVKNLKLTLSQPGFFGDGCK